MVDTRKAALRSSVPGIDWPPIPATQAATMLALLEQMEESQWWPAEVLREHQMRQLRALLRHAANHVSYYGGEGGPDAQDRTGAMDLRGWSRLPVLTREEVQYNYAALQGLEVPPSHGRVSELSTSGSTGRPITVKTTLLSRICSAVCGLRAHRWHRRDLSGHLASIHIDRGDRAGYPDGFEQPGWGWPADKIYRTGPAALLSLRTPLEQQAAWLQRRNPHYVLSCPSNLLALARYCGDQAVELPRLRDVATIMEVVTPELRETVRRAWNVPVVDVYSAKETGCIAVQCPDHDHYHVMSEVVFVEILDEQDQTCGPGEVGRVVVTPLHNFAMPLLRYELGDYAEVGQPCPCGRGMPVLERILGRVRNMLILPDGRQHWPSFSRRKLVEAVPVIQHQMVQKDLQTLELRLVADRPFTSEEEESVRRIVLDRLPVPFEMSFNYVDAIERSPGGKFEDFYSEVAPSRPTPDGSQ